MSSQIRKLLVANRSEIAIRVFRAAAEMGIRFHGAPYVFSTSNAQAGADGQADHSAEAVRFRIKALIDQETADTVLSDDRIVDVLREDGIDIARRTVAKYREAMRIPSSVQRRREKSLRF